MRHNRPITFLVSAALVPLAALAVAACGGGNSATAAPPPAKPKPATTQPTSIRVANSHLGQILVNAQGRTLYLFKADVGTKSECTGACAVAWPPLHATGNVAAGTGVTASKLGTTTRSDGTKQVTYNGHPLYLFIQDKKPGDVTGQGVVAFGAAWFVLSPAGNQIPSRSTPPPAAKPATKPASPPATQPASPPATQPAPKAAPPPAPKPAPQPSNGIPQNGGGDNDSDNHGGPSDGDGNV